VLVRLVDDDVHRYVIDTVGGYLGHRAGPRERPSAAAVPMRSTWAHR
jgi:hypothetical protein